MKNLENKEIFAKNLKYYMDKNNLDRNKLCEDLDLKYMTLSDWINAKTYPRIDKIELLADYFKINKSDLIEDKVSPTPSTRLLSNKEKEILMPFNKLNGEGQNKVIDYTYDLLNSDKYVEEEVASYIGYAAAGRGYNYLDDIKVDIAIPKKDRPNYDFIIKVTGDSMAPKIKNGSLAFVKVNTDYDNGKIYVVDNDGSVFIKKVFFEQDRIILRSINKKYGDIEITFSDGFRVLGEVVDFENQ